MGKTKNFENKNYILFFIFRLSVVKTYTGHGVGRLFHCEPNVPHYANNKTPGFMKVLKL